MQVIDFDLLAHFVSMLLFFMATIVVFSLYKELRHEKYWVGFPIGIGFFFVHEVLETLEQFYDILIFDFGAEVSEVIGAFFIMYASFGLRNILLNINKVMNEENSEISEE